MDILTTEEAATAVGIADDLLDTKLGVYVSAISDRLETACGPIIQRAVTEYQDGSANYIYLQNYPIAEVTSVTEYDATVPTVLTEQTHLVEPDDGYVLQTYTPDAAFYGPLIVRTAAGAVTPFAAGLRNIKVVYTAGRYADVTEVSAKFKQAAILMLKNVWRAEQISTVPFNEYDLPAQSFPTFAIPNAVKELLRGEWQEGIKRGFA